MNYNETQPDTIAELFRLRKCKYETLENALNNVGFDFNKRTILFIDINKLSRSIFKEEKIEKRIFELLSGIMGFVSYYRHFFYLHNIIPDIFIYGDSANDYDEYEYLENEFWQEYVAEEIEALKLITQYLPCTYFVDTKEIPERYAPTVILKSIKIDPSYNIVFGISDHSDMTVISSSIRPCYGIHLSGLHTKVYTANSYKEYMNNFTRPENLLSIVGCEPRNIEGIKGVGLKRASKLKLTNIEEDIKNKFGDGALRKYNYNMDYFSFSKWQGKITPSYKGYIKDQLIDLYDKSSLEKFNREHCSVYPMSIRKLTLGI